jgi:hypothetical protein
MAAQPAATETTDGALVDAAGTRQPATGSADPDAEPSSDPSSPSPVANEQAGADAHEGSAVGPRQIIAVPAIDERGASLAGAEAGAVDADPVNAPAGPVAATAAPRGPTPAGVTFSGIPAVTYIADNGLGLGIIAAAYFHDGVTTPYRTAITLQIFATTKLVQDHNVIVDSLRLFDLPLRLNARLGYVSSLTQNYCGIGGTVTCDVAVAQNAAVDAGLDPDSSAYDTFVGRYYQRRFMNPYGLVNLRYALIERRPGQPTRVELTGGYRAFAFFPGDLFADEDGDGAPDQTPYPGSLYARDFPDGEPGLSSVVNAGLMLDSRDTEPSPTEGWWMEGSLRATTPGLSTWNYGGFNVTVRGYTHLPVDVPGHGSLGRRLVLANRFTVDGVVGDIPVQELARADRKSRCSKRSATERTVLVNFESMAYFDPLDGAA